MDADQVPERDPGRGHWHVGVQGGGRRGALHRVRQQEEGRAGHRPPGRAPDPRRARVQEAGRRAGHPVRPVALPRVLHHRARRSAGRRRGGQHPPRPRDHRAGPRRPQGLSAGSPAVRAVCREQCLARPRGHRVQPHPRRCRPHRGTRAGQGDHRHRAPQADPRSGPGRDLGPPDHAAPAPALAMAAGMDPPVRPGRQARPPPPRPDHLRRHRRHPEEPAREHPDTQVGRSPTPPHDPQPEDEITLRDPSDLLATASQEDCRVEAVTGEVPVEVLGGPVAVLPGLDNEDRTLCLGEDEGSVEPRRPATDDDHVPDLLGSVCGGSRPRPPSPPAVAARSRGDHIQGSAGHHRRSGRPRVQSSSRAKREWT